MEPSFAIEETICKMGKISINLEKNGPNDEVIVFCIPITGALLPAAMAAEDPANLIAGDPYFTRSILNDNKGFVEPMKWLRAPISFPEKYEGARVSIKFPSDEVVDFEGSRVGDIELSGVPGSLTRVDFQIQIKPELDRVNLLLQEYQDHKIRITVLDAKIARKKTKGQQQLPLTQSTEEKELSRSTPEELAAAEQRSELSDELDRQFREADANRQYDEAARGLEGKSRADMTDEQWEEFTDREHAENIDGESDGTDDSQDDGAGDEE